MTITATDTTQDSAIPPGTATTAATISSAIFKIEKTRFSAGTSAARRMPVSTKSWITKIDQRGVATTKNTISGRWPAASTSSSAHRSAPSANTAPASAAAPPPTRYPPTTSRRATRPATGTKRRSA